jgi:hypothetical protein
VDNEIKDYDPLLEGNKSQLDERDDFHYHCEDLQVDLAEVCSDAMKRTIDLEAKLESVEAHSVDVAAASERRLMDFEDELIHDLVKLRSLYVRNAQAIGGLRSPMPSDKPSATDYL